MTNLLITERQSIVTALQAAGVTAFDDWAPRVTPYSATVVPGYPYISTGSPGELPFGHAVVNHRVVIIGGKGTVTVQTEKVGDLVLRVLAALPGRWDEVSEPYLTNVSALGDVLAIDVTVPTAFKIPQEVP